MFETTKLFKRLKKMKAKDFKLRRIRPIKEDQTLLEIFNIIGTSDLPIIPVINKKGEYIGIITLKDLLFLFRKKHTSIHETFSHLHTFSNYTAAEVINLHLPIIYDDDPLEQIMENMAEFKTSVLPRAKNRKEEITGLLYLSDIFTEIRNIIRQLVSEVDEKTHRERDEKEGKKHT